MAEALDIRVRQPVMTDASAMSGLYLERYDDIIPGWQSWKTSRKRYLVKHGEAYFADQISRAMQFPDRYFARVATVEAQEPDASEEIAGFAYAIADHGNNRFARLVGLVVDRQYERRQVGTQLEAARQEWADERTRVLYGQIVHEDESAWDFYRKQGYRSVGTRAMEQTVFRLIERTPEGSPVATAGLPWSERLLDNEPLVY